jgi:hypothetical protein
MSTTDAQPIDSNQYIDLATRYAKLRWCWDDETMIKEFCEKELETDKPASPKTVVDELADEYVFGDPFGPWGSANQVQKDQCTAVEAQISAIFPEQPEPAKGLRP